MVLTLTDALNADMLNEKQAGKEMFIDYSLCHE